MRIAVAHHSLNIPSGAERLCLSVIEAVRNEGHEISLLTVKKKIGVRSGKLQTVIMHNARRTKGLWSMEVYSSIVLSKLT